MNDRLVRLVHWMFQGTANLLVNDSRVAVALGYVLAVVLLVMMLMSLPIALAVERYEKVTEGKQN